MTSTLAGMYLTCMICCILCVCRTSLAAEEFPVMTRTPGHSELGAPLPTAAAAAAAAVTAQPAPPAATAPPTVTADTVHEEVKDTGSKSLGAEQDTAPATVELAMADCDGCDSPKTATDTDNSTVNVPAVESFPLAAQLASWLRGSTHDSKDVIETSGSAGAESAPSSAVKPSQVGSSTACRHKCCPE